MAFSRSKWLRNVRKGLEVLVEQRIDLLVKHVEKFILVLEIQIDSSRGILDLFRNSAYRGLLVAFLHKIASRFQDGICIPENSEQDLL